MPGNPLVSVVLPVKLKDASWKSYFDAAVSSILSQRFSDFELIIVDGTRPGEAGLLSSLEDLDNRIVHIRRPDLDLVGSLNEGCRASRGKYIARMDADDVSLPDRLGRQVDYLEAHSEIGVLGTWLRIFDAKGRAMKDVHYPETPGIVRWTLIFDNCIAHPTVMMRRDTVAPLGFYRSCDSYGVPLAEDYDLWVRASAVSGVANLPEVLLLHRFWADSKTAFEEKSLKVMGAEVVPYIVSRFIKGGDLMRDVSPLQNLMNYHMTIESAKAASASRFIERLYGAYMTSSSLDPTEARLVTADAATRLFHLAWLSRKGPLLVTVPIVLRALHIHPALVLPWDPAFPLRMLMDHFD